MYIILFVPLITSHCWHWLCCAASLYRSRIFVKVYERTSRVWDVKKEFEVQAQNEPLLAIVREKVSSGSVAYVTGLCVYYCTQEDNGVEYSRHR